MAECNMPDLTLDQTGETSFSGMSEFCVEKVEEVSTKKEVGVCTLTEMVENMVDGEYRFFQSLANKALEVLNA